jgi:hypothetical protein
VTWSNCAFLKLELKPPNNCCEWLKGFSKTEKVRVGTHRMAVTSDYNPRWMISSTAGIITGEILKEFGSKS